MVRFLATADWQLGMSATFLDEQARVRYTQARFDVIARIGAVAGADGCAFVVVAGDVFESNQLDRRVLSQAFEALRAVPVPVYVLPGNHDPLDAASIYRSEPFARRCPEHVHVLAEPGVTEVAPDVQLLAAPWYTKRPLVDLAAAACADQPPEAGAGTGSVRVLVGHGAVDSLSPDAANPAVVSASALAAALTDRRIDFAVLGDRHSTTRVADRVWYPGTPEVTDRTEKDPGNVLVVDVGPGGCDVRSVRVGRWRFVTRAGDLADEADVADLEGWLAGQDDKARTAVWLALRGTLSLAAKARLDDVVEHADEVFAQVRLWASHTDLAVRPDQHDLDALALTGFARDAMAELTTLAGSGNGTARTAEDALGLLYRLAGGGR